MAEPEEPKHGRILGLAEGQPRYRLLIVEDQPENRLLLRRLLDPLGFELREAANGQEAVALFEQWHPDLIWMDIRMPVMDGLEADPADSGNQGRRRHQDHRTHGSRAGGRESTNYGSRLR